MGKIGRLHFGEAILESVLDRISNIPLDRE